MVSLVSIIQDMCSRCFKLLTLNVPNPSAAHIRQGPICSFPLARFKLYTQLEPFTPLVIYQHGPQDPPSISSVRPN